MDPAPDVSPERTSEAAKGSDGAHAKPPPSRERSRSRSRSAPPRSYAELKAEFKKGRGVNLTKAESKIYWSGKRDEWEAERDRHEIAAQRFWDASKHVTRHVLVKALFYSVYALWSAPPIAGIVIGLVYINSDNCPGQPSIAPLLVVLGLLTIFVGLSIVTSRHPAPAVPANGAEPDLTNNSPAVSDRPSSTGASLSPGAARRDSASPGRRQSTPDPRRGGGSSPKPLPNGDSPLHDDSDIELGSIAETYTLGETLGICAGGFFVCFVIIFKFAHLILFIATSVIVYRFAGRVQFSKTNLSDDDVQYVYCNEILFRFAYWSISLALGILALLLIGCCFGCCTFVAWTSYAARQPPREPPPKQPKAKAKP